ncbi:hypothetical protein Bca52824_078208 [Brassica carinata]|uniref:Replication protein A 70 kDa DNA-binding subunit B/D first OB fold domain-containing protein n=1 Tax=Brassica carinata TaxID=52824 RepID=A0A8X7TYY0_BRACI|nr:hypothetical protein Bca52824_078208 [Brassica carinata]
MSASRKMVLINDLKPFKEEWRIRLKLLHTWKTKTDYGANLLSIPNYIESNTTFLQGQKIHASCKRTLMYRVQRDIQLGERRELENFKISATGGQNRPSKFQYKLTVIGDTKIKPTDYRDENQFLSLASYEEIVTGKLKTFFLIDVMGQVVDLGEVVICQLKTGENMKRVNFRLRDTRMSQTDLPLALLGSDDENKVRLTDYNIESSSDVSTPFSKRKEGDAELSYMNSTSKKLRAQSIKSIKHSKGFLSLRQPNYEKKRQISKEISYKENDNTDCRNIQPSVAICSVFKRIFDDLDLRPISKYNNVREGQNISTPKTSTCKRRCVLGVDLVSNQNQNTLQRSCLTSLSSKDKSSAETKTLHKCLHRRKKIPVLVDITNFSETHFSEVDNAQEGLCTRTPKTPSYKRRRVLGKSRSTETNTTHVPNKRKQRRNKITVGYDIPNIDQLHDDHIEDDPKK